MKICIGTDEAGYGPNLGPLVVAATAWQLPDDLSPDAMWAALADVLTDTPQRADHRLHVADSKKVYSSGRTIKSLERSVFAFLDLLGQGTTCLSEIGNSFCSEQFAADYEEVRRDVISDIKLPTAITADDRTANTASLATALEQTQIRLLSIECRTIFPREFNSEVARTDSKGVLLAGATLQLIRNAVDRSHLKSGWVVCDKHGGRNRYDDIISATFDDEFVFRLEESGPSSRYRIGELEFCFRTKAEELLPVALASMTAKYVREMVMEQFNRFWKHYLPELKPTKGYPVDAKRFWDDVSDKAKELEIDKAEMWRCR